MRTWFSASHRTVLWNWHPGGLLGDTIVSDLNGDAINEIIIVSHGDRVSVLTAKSLSQQ